MYKQEMIDKWYEWAVFDFSYSNLCKEKSM